MTKTLLLFVLIKVKRKWQNHCVYFRPLLANNTPIVWKEEPLEKKIMTIVFYNEKALLTVEVADSSCFFPRLHELQDNALSLKDCHLLLAQKVC